MCYEHALIALGTYANFLQQVVYLTFDGAYLDLGVDQGRWDESLAR